MSKKVYETTYSWGPQQMTARVTKLAANRYTLYLSERGRDVARRHMTAADWQAIKDRLYDDFTTPTHDFDSIWPLRAYAITGDYDADSIDIEIALHDAA